MSTYLVAVSGGCPGAALGPYVDSEMFEQARGVHRLRCGGADTVLALIASSPEDAAAKARGELSRTRRSR